MPTISHSSPLWFLVCKLRTRLFKKSFKLAENRKIYQLDPAAMKCLF